MEPVDVYYSFRSPYSYLATPGMLQLREDYEVEVNLRVVYPIALRSPETLFTPENANRVRYILMDWVRRAEFLGMPGHWPSPDPIVQDFENGMRVAEEQPYIYRLCALGVEAQRRGRGIDFAAAVSGMVFSGVQGWDQGDHLAKAVEQAGLSLAELDAAIEGGDQLEEIPANQARLEAVGGWGVPTFVVRDEPFFGQDRIDTLHWRLDQYGLKR